MRLALGARCGAGRMPLKGFSIAPGADGAAELTVLKRLYAEQRENFVTDADAAKKLLAVGEKRNGGVEKLDPVDLAAGTSLAIALFNHDAAIMRR